MTGLKKSFFRLTMTANGHRLAAVLLVLLLSAACASGNGKAIVTGQPVTLGDSLAGNYLAGRFAQSQRDMSKAADFLNTALDMAPRNPGLLRRIFMLMVAENRLKEATELARRIIDADIKTPFANLTLILHHILTDRLDKAEGHLPKLTADGIDALLSPLVRAWVWVGQGKGVEAALGAIEPLAQKNGSKALHDFHAGLINELTGRSEEAEKSYLAAVEGQGGLSLRIVEILGTFYERLGKAEKAAALYQKYMQQNPQSHYLEQALARLQSGDVPALQVSTASDGIAEGLFGLASSLRQQNARMTALVIGRLALHIKPDFPIMQTLLAEIFESQNRLQSANAIYASINGNSPYSWPTRLRLATNLDRMERTDDAIKQLHAMAADTDRAEPLITLGDVLRRHERFKEAISAYDQAFKRIEKLERQHWSLLYARGIALEQSKMWARAEADLLKALEFEPEQPYVLNYLGYSWVDQGVNLDRALKMIKKAVALRPSDGYIIDSMGWVLYRLGKYENSVRELERAVELRPEDPIINDHLGDAYWWVGRDDEARFQWQRALGLDPKPDIAANLHEKIKRGLIKKSKDGDDG
jgi:tetratricopeptide (TPR) repeat protein